MKTTKVLLSKRMKLGEGHFDTNSDQPGKQPRPAGGYWAGRRLTNPNSGHNGSGPGRGLS